MDRYVAEWRDYRLEVYFHGGTWRFSVYHIPNKKWAWEHDADDLEDGKSQAVETAIDDAGVPDEQEDQARAEIKWLRRPK
jgi:hypothetical protein